MSVVFTMTQEAEVVRHKICRTVIRSDARLNYDEAQAMIESGCEQKQSGLWEAIHGLDKIARILRGKRFEAGALVLEQDEMRFRLDEQGEPVEIYFERPNEAHHLIEEFMLLANRTVAEAVGKKPFVYRIHDKPDKEKLRDSVL